MPLWDGSKVEAKTKQEYPLIPAGEYIGVVDRVKEKQSRVGEPQWGVLWRIRDGEHAGLMVWDNLTWSKASEWRIKWCLSDLGVYRDGEIDWVPELIIGKQCRIEVIQKDRNGKLENVIKAFHRMTDTDKKDDDLPF